MRYYQSLIESSLELMGETGKDYIYRCPFCEGSTGSGHLYINYDKNVYHCYKCDVGGRDIKYLLFRMGYSLDESTPSSILSDKSSSSLRLNDTIELLSKKNRTPPSVKSGYSIDTRVCTEYYLYHTTELSQSSLDYLHHRGLSDDQIYTYKMREGLNRYGSTINIGDHCYRGKDYSSRILVPSIIRGSSVEISYYVARDTTGKKNPKYLNPPSDIALSSEDVWNLDTAKRVSNTVVICEGVFTAISAGYNAVATYGKSLAERSNSGMSVMSQADKLIDAGFDKYIVAYDADAAVKVDCTCEYLSQRGLNVYYVKVPPLAGPKTDLSDLPEDVRRDLLSNPVKYTQESRLSLLM